MKKLIVAIAFIILLVALFMLGPKTPEPTFDQSWPPVKAEPADIAKNLEQRELEYQLRSNNQARIIWADSARESKLVFLYLHGFSASQMEGYPFHRALADSFGANLYLARLAGHGYLKNSLEDFTAESGWQSAKEALAQASQLGDSLIILSTSTGGTFALMLAAAYPEKVHGLINLSPNIRVNNPVAFLLDGPWGKEIANMVVGPQRRIEPDTPAYALYWDTLYTINAVVELQSLLEAAMVPQTFIKIKQPVLNMYFYKNEEEQDKVVDVERIQWMHRHLSTPDSLQSLVALSTPGNHVLGSPIKSNDVDTVINTALVFCREKLGFE